MSTTIRVPKDLHARLSRQAAAEGSTLAAVIEHALEAEETASFWREVRRTMVTTEARSNLATQAERVVPSLRDGLVPGESWDDVL